MKQIEFIDTIYNILSPIDKTGRFHKKQIESVCDVAYSQRIATFYEDMLGDIELFTKEYTSQTVTEDATKERYYTTIPADVVAVPRITTGILHVNVDSGLDLDFAPTTEREYNYMGGTVTEMEDTTIGYWVQGTKIWYNDSMTADIASAGVRIVLIPRFSAYARTDTVYIPGGSDMDFIKEVLEILGVTQPVDLKANNA